MSHLVLVLLVVLSALLGVFSWTETLPVGGCRYRTRNPVLAIPGLALDLYRGFKSLCRSLLGRLVIIPVLGVFFSWFLGAAAVRCGFLPERGGLFVLLLIAFFVGVSWPFVARRIRVFLPRVGWWGDESALQRDRTEEARDMERSVQANARRADAEQAWRNAARSGSCEAVRAATRVLLAAGANVNVRRENGGMTALMFASGCGDVEAVRGLLRAGADPDAVDDRGRTALLYAARAEHADALRALLRWTTWPARFFGALCGRVGADVNAADRKGATALMFAALSGHVESLRVLLEAGADPDARAKYGAALARAAWNDHVEAVRELLRAGADPNIVGADGRTPLLRAAKKGHVESLLTLLDAGADVNVVCVPVFPPELFADPDAGMTALMFAAQGGHAEALRLLLDRGADAKAKDAAGRTALNWAEGNGHAEAARLLREAGGRAQCH